MSAALALPAASPSRAPSARPALRRLAARAAAFLLAGAAACALAIGAERLIAERRAAELAALEGRLSALAAGRAEVLATWIDGLARLARRLTGSELVRLFVHEAILAGSDARLAPALAEQAPYMALVLEELARQSGLEGVGLLAEDGSWLVRDAGAALPERVARALLRELAEARPGPRAWLVADERATRLVLAVPLPPPEAAAGERPRAAVVLVVPARETLARYLRPQPVDGPGVGARLEAEGAGDEPLRLGPDGRPLAEATAGSRSFVEVAANVPGLPWRVAIRAEPETVLAAHERWASSVRAAVAGFGLAAGALVLALLAWQRVRHERSLAEQWQEAARAIEAERRLLAEVSDAVPDFVSLKDARGRWLMVNRALANALGRGARELLGRREEEVVAGEGVGRLLALERQALSTGGAVQPELALRLGGRERVLHVLVLALPDPTGGPPRILRVARDLSDLVAERRRAQRLREQTVAALLRAVELADPHLLGHSRMLADLAERLALRLDLDPKTIATVRVAGELSQIGKLFVPRALLRKESRHDEAESRLMRTHVDHALRVLEGVEFDLPVAEAIAQMYERLDGTGYPRGLAGPQIGIEGRILAVADVFVARTRPRSYRDAAPPDAVLAVLRAHPERYDAAVVAALAEELAENGWPGWASSARGSGAEDRAQPVEEVLGGERAQQEAQQAREHGDEGGTEKAREPGAGGEREPGGGEDGELGEDEGEAAVRRGAQAIGQEESRGDRRGAGDERNAEREDGDVGAGAFLGQEFGRALAPLAAALEDHLEREKEQEEAARDAERGHGDPEPTQRRLAHESEAAQDDPGEEHRAAGQLHALARGGAGGEGDEDGDQPQRIDGDEKGDQSLPEGLEHRAAELSRSPGRRRDRTPRRW